MDTVQNVLGWIGAIPLLWVFSRWRVNDLRTGQALKAAAAILLPLWAVVGVLELAQRAVS